MINKITLILFIIKFRDLIIKEMKDIKLCIKTNFKDQI